MQANSADRSPDTSVHHSLEPEDSRRSSPRVRAELTVDLWVNSEVHDTDARTANISEEGMFVATRNPLPVGTMALFKMILPSGDTVAGFAEVAWLRPRQESSSQPNGMGLRYVAIRENGSDLVRRFVHSVQLDADGTKATVRLRDHRL